jgi:hypothetical protein
MVNSGMNMPHSNVETQKIKMLEFGLLNPEEIVNFLSKNSLKCLCAK